MQRMLLKFLNRMRQELNCLQLIHSCTQINQFYTFILVEFLKVSIVCIYFEFSDYMWSLWKHKVVKTSVIYMTLYDLDDQ